MNHYQAAVPVSRAGIRVCNSNSLSIAAPCTTLLAGVALFGLICRLSFWRDCSLGILVVCVLKQTLHCSAFAIVDGLT